MFGSLHNLLDPAAFSSNRFGELWVDDMCFPLVAFAALEVDATVPQVFAPTEVPLSQVLAFAKGQASIWQVGLALEDEAGDGSKAAAGDADGIPVLSLEGYEVRALTDAWMDWKEAQSGAAGVKVSSAARVVICHRRLAGLAVPVADRVLEDRAGAAGEDLAGADGSDGAEAGTDQALAEDGAGQVPLRILALSTCKYPDSVERVVILLRILPAVEQ